MRRFDYSQERSPFLKGHGSVLDVGATGRVYPRSQGTVVPSFEEDVRSFQKDRRAVDAYTRISIRQKKN